MPVFEYTALDQRGKNVTGIIDADSSVAARQKLRASNKFPVDIKEALDIQAKKIPGALRYPNCSSAYGNGTSPS